MAFMLRWYDKILKLANHPHAVAYLALISFIEASFFPIPPYVMLAPMALAKPTRANYYAGVATLASVMGGIFGYLLGFLIFKPLVLPLLEYFGYVHMYQSIIDTFNVYGFLTLLILGFTPIPYKLVAICAGFLAIPIHIFILTSIISRGLKFFVLAIIMKFGGGNIDRFVRFALQRLNFWVMGLCGILFFVALKVI